MMDLSDIYDFEDLMTTPSDEDIPALEDVSTDYGLHNNTYITLKQCAHIMDTFTFKMCWICVHFTVIYI